MILMDSKLNKSQLCGLAARWPTVAIWTEVDRRLRHVIGVTGLCQKEAGNRMIAAFRARISMDRENLKP